jgi:long-chain acyl-CoA synthetase
VTNLVADIETTAEEHPDATAIAANGREITYAEFWSRTGRFAAALADAGIEPGDRVALYLPNVPQFLTAFHGVLRAGGVVVPMNPQYKAREISHLLADSEASVVVSLADLVPRVEAVMDDTDLTRVVSVGADDSESDTSEAVTPFEAFLAEEEIPVVSRADDDVAIQPYTSGTTGQPKGVLLTHRNVAWDARASASLMDGGVKESDKFLGVLPLFHIYGMTITMVAVLFKGGSFYPLPAWDAGEALSLIEREELTVMHGVPAMFNDVLNQPNAAEFDLSSVRFANSGGDSLPTAVMEGFEELYGIELYEGYGLTETSPVTHANSPGYRRPGSIGQPIEGVEAMIVTDEFEPAERVERGPVDEERVDLDAISGELVISGPNVMKGYHDRPEANEEVFTEYEGKRWFHTGDVGYWDEENFFFIVDREKHVIVTGGYNVYPREVEELLYEHEAVADAAVVGIPDERRNETIKAFVAPVPDSEVSAEAIKEYCLANLAAYKHPREIEFREELPRTTTGKVQKFELAEE